jgi:hypothetical protein
MKLALSLPGGLVGIWLLAFPSTVHAHTWLESLRLIASNGSFVGPLGYPRAFFPRGGTPTPDDAMVYRLDGVISSTALVCNSRQTVGTQSQGFPPLSAAPGDQIAMQYLENGHVTQLLQPNRPARSGTVFVYGTKQPSNTDTYLGIHRVWNADGTGGDKRGKLLATRPYDDGQCYQVNSTPKSAERQKEFPRPASSGNDDLPCQTDVQLPTDAGTTGTYTLYWVWEWPLLTPTGGIQANESYTGCVDVTMTSKKVADAGAYVQSQPAISRAIAQQLTTPLLIDPKAQEALTTAPFLQPSVTPAGPNSPVASSAPAASASASTPTPVKGSSSSTPPKGFVTVTVTGPAQEKMQTVTVTDTIYMSGSKPTTQATVTPQNSSPTSMTQSKSTPAASKASSSSSSSSNPTASSAASAASSAPYVSYVPSAVPSVDPFLSPESKVIQVPSSAAASSTATAASSGATESACRTYGNGTMASPTGKRRRRPVRL